MFIGFQLITLYTVVSNTVGDWLPVTLLVNFHEYFFIKTQMMSTQKHFNTWLAWTAEIDNCKSAEKFKQKFLNLCKVQAHICESFKILEANSTQVCESIYSESGSKLVNLLLKLEEPSSSVVDFPARMSSEGEVWPLAGVGTSWCCEWFKFCHLMSWTYSNHDLCRSC